MLKLNRVEPLDDVPRPCYSGGMSKISYGKLSTEQVNPRTRNIDQISIKKAIELMHREDASVAQVVHREKKHIAQAVRLITASLRQGGRLFFAGAGTSGRLGVIEAAECPPTFNTPPSLVQAVMAGGKDAVFQSKEGAEDDHAEGYRIFKRKLKSQDVVVGIAASGVTPFVYGALEAAQKIGASTILVSCNKKLPQKVPAKCIIAAVTGSEVISGSTRLKAGTATKLILNQLTVLSMVQLGKVYQNWMVDLQPKSRKLEARALRLVCHLGGLPEKRAQKILKAAGGHAKTAIFMARTGCDAKTAQKKLKKADGFLAKALVNGTTKQFHKPL
jgi:N-acetylmuramic acid 6-phosphate etherase